MSAKAIIRPHQSFALEILPHFYVKNIFIAQKLMKWQGFNKYIGKSTKIIFKNCLKALKSIYVIRFHYFQVTSGENINFGPEDKNVHMTPYFGPMCSVLLRSLTAILLTAMMRLILPAPALGLRRSQPWSCCSSWTRGRR